MISQELQIYLHNLKPGEATEQQFKLFFRAMKYIHQLEKDKERLDFLANEQQSIGRVFLHVSFAADHPGDLRASIDDAMDFWLNNYGGYQK